MWFFVGSRFPASFFTSFLTITTAWPLMVDSLNLKLTKSGAGYVDLIKEIPQYLDPGSVAFHTYNNGFTVITGKVGNLSAAINPDRVIIGNGSLCKFMLGDNYQTMRRQDIRCAIELLSDKLHLPMARAQITRLDFGLTIPVEDPPANYFNHLGELSRAQRLTEPSGLYYCKHRDSFRLCFYDKNREQRDKREPIPAAYRDANVMRYELRYLKRLPKLLNAPIVTAAMLYDRDFFRSLLNRWFTTYHAINKINMIAPDTTGMTNKRELARLGIIALAKSYGGELQLLAHFREQQRCGKLTAKQAYDLRQEVKKAFAAAAKGGQSEQPNVITELGQKIADAVEAYS